MGVDLYLALAVMLVLAAAVFVVGVALSRRVSKRTVILIAIADLICLVAFMKYLWDSPWMIRAIPARGVIVLGNLQPVLSALLGGIGWGMIKGKLRRRVVFIVPLVAISLWRGYGRLFQGVPETRTRWKGDVCRQTSNATCSAAAACTLLRVYGIEASETEMARLSLTRRDGTTVHGRYRGLVLKTDDTPFTVEAIVAADLEELRRLSAAGPVILSVGLTDARSASARYIDTYGWLPGMRHTVVLFGFSDDGKVDIGDPSVGREQWSVEDLKVLWQGNGFRLVRRSATSQ